MASTFNFGGCRNLRILNILKFSQLGFRDVDNSLKPGKLPGCEHDFSGCKALLVSPKCF